MFVLTRSTCTYTGSHAKKGCGWPFGTVLVCLYAGGCAVCDPPNWITSYLAPCPRRDHPHCDDDPPAGAHPGAGWALCIVAIVVASVDLEGGGGLTSVRAFDGVCEQQVRMLSMQTLPALPVIDIRLLTLCTVRHYTALEA